MDKAIATALSTTGGETDPDGVIRRALQAVRSHLGLSVAYVSRFEGEQSVFRQVDAPGLEHVIKAGDSRPLDDVYCRHILAGRLPELMPDTSTVPLAAAMPITAASSIGAHISVPIRLPDGEPYGMFCCLGFSADPTLNDRDLQTLRAFAEIASFEIGREQEQTKASDEKRRRIEQVLAGDGLIMAFQPICDVESLSPAGFECLARFDPVPRRTPDLWFAEAAEVGLGVDLELVAIRRALDALGDLPSPLYLGVNASPEAIVDVRFPSLLETRSLDRLVLEITEHATVDDYDRIGAALEPLRARGLCVAIDDAGAGYASFRHILNMRPDIIKLDMALTRSIDLDPARRALARALISFAHDTGSEIVAEGVETRSELRVLRELGADKAQGYLLGRPGALDAALSPLAGRQRAADAA